MPASANYSWITLLLLASLSARVASQNILVNGDFEAGELAPWTCTSEAGGECVRFHEGALPVSRAEALKL